MTFVRFEVIGMPATKGSFRVFRLPNGAPRVVKDTQRTYSFEQDIRNRAAMEMVGVDPTHLPCELDLTIYLPRPKAHYHTGKRAGELRADAPDKVDKKPDWDKVARAVGDALEGVVYRGDQQVADATVRKRYREQPGVVIEVRW